VQTPSDGPKASRPSFAVRERERLSPEIKEIVSSDRQEDVRRCQDLGATGYVVKSVDYREYNQVLISITEYGLLGRTTETPRPAASHFTALT
jgi:DNA-binding NarL/FixJ family response regulator